MSEEKSATGATRTFTKNGVTFSFVARGTRHSMGVSLDGIAYSWGRSNELGQLGRNTETASKKKPGRVEYQQANSSSSSTTSPPFQKVAKAFVSQGSDVDSGHSAILDESGTRLYMAGCDRWQQLGLGSSNGGSSGYTWKDGKLWQTEFVPSDFVISLLQEEDPTASIRDVALGGDHTMVLSSDQKSVFVFGKGGDGQLGVGKYKPYVSAPVKSALLSKDGTAAICAYDMCSFSLNSSGNVHAQAGKGCSASHVQEALQKCQRRAQEKGLVKGKTQS